MYNYDAFGNLLNSSGTTPNNYLYRGEQYDTNLGLYYLRARYLNPATGRFMSRDPEDGKPIDPKTLHKYLYAGGDPINRVDPRGRDETEYPVLLANESWQSQLEMRATAHVIRATLECVAYLLEGNIDNVWTVDSAFDYCIEVFVQ